LVPGVEKGCRAFIECCAIVLVPGVEKGCRAFIECCAIGFVPGVEKGCRAFIVCCAIGLVPGVEKGCRAFIECCAIGLVPGVEKGCMALIFRDIWSVLALLDPEDEGPVFQCNVRDCTRKDSNTSQKTQIFATLIESHQGRENTNSVTNCLASVVFHQVAAPKPSMHFFSLLYILYILPIYSPVILSPKQHLVSSTNYGTTHNAVEIMKLLIMQFSPVRFTSFQLG